MTDSRDVTRRRSLPFRLSVEENDGIAVHIVYALYAASIVFGILSVLGAMGIPSVLGVILAYLKRPDLRGSWLESHATWQIGTFWGLVIGSVLSLVLLATFILIPLAWIAGAATWVWFVWRTLWGWYRLSQEEPVGRPRSSPWVQ